MRKCKYTGENKYLVEIEDKVDDETLERLRLEEEVAAATGELPDDFAGFSLHMGGVLPPDTDEAQTGGPGNNENVKVKLETFPAIEEGMLAQRIKKYKDHAINRKQKFKTASEKLRDEKSSGHELLSSKRAMLPGDSYVIPFWVYRMSYIYV